MPRMLTWENGVKIVREMTPEEIEANKPTAEQIRKERDCLLKKSDLRMIPDAPWDTTAWATYRQALRDIPLQEGFPTDVVWPTEPE